MSYYAYSGEEYIGDVASISGWDAFRAWAKGRGKALDALLESGDSDNLVELLSDLRSGHSTDEDTDSVRTNLIALVNAAMRAGNTLTISDGVEE